MKEIELTKDLKTQVDDEDYEYLSQFTWHAVDNHGTFYARTAKKLNGRVYCTYMHRLLVDCPPELEIDHIDRNPLNNQKANLRVVTHGMNLMNRSRRKSTICPKCGQREKYKWSGYCLECHYEYVKERNKKPELREKATEYKREYRARKRAEKAGGTTQNNS